MERKRTYIRQWRNKRGYTLAQMVGRLAELEVPTTEATLSRIETTKQPYSQDIMEAIADALDVDVWQLTGDNPEIPSAPVADFIRRLSEKEAAQAEAVLRAMFENRAEQ